MPGGEWITDSQKDMMDRLIVYLDLAEIPFCFGQEKDGRFFIAIKGNRINAIILKLSI
jgi:hypothetical protein